MSKKALEIAKELLKHVQDNPASVQELSKNIHAAAQAAPAPAAAPMKKCGYFKNLAQKNQMGKAAMPGMGGMPKPSMPKPAMPMPAPAGGGSAGGPKGSAKPKPIVGNARKEELDKAKILAGPGHAAKPGTVLADLPSKPTGDKGKATMTRTGTAADATIHPASPAKYRNAVRGKTAAKEAPKKTPAAAGVAKSENPDKEADAKLGEKVEGACEEHMKENAAAETKEGHKPWQMSKEEIKADVRSPYKKEDRLPGDDPMTVADQDKLRTTFKPPKSEKYGSKVDGKIMSKEEIKAEVMKSATAEGAKGIMASKIIKPSDVKDAGVDKFAVSKDAAGYKKEGSDGKEKK